MNKSKDMIFAIRHSFTVKLNVLFIFFAIYFFAILATVIKLHGYYLYS